MQERRPVNREVRESQIDPTAGIWFCPNCGRRIQVVTSSEVPKVQSFTCVCGTSMEPGEEYAPEEQVQNKVVDD